MSVSCVLELVKQSIVANKIKESRLPGLHCEELGFTDPGMTSTIGG
jgi:hypothetical protein